MSQPSNDYRTHRRQDSLLYHNDIDPYRIRRSPRHSHELGMTDGESDALHSRSASDSSNNRLTAHPAQPAMRETFTEDSLGEDPYAPRQTGTPKTLWRGETDRANSYLPYSHHTRDPFQAPAAPMYIEDDESLRRMPHKEDGGVGSMLHDNITVDMEAASSQPPHTLNHPSTLRHDPLSIPELATPRKRQHHRKYCGLRCRTLALLVFFFLALVAVVWFFVWPRVPDMTLADVDMPLTDWLTNSTKGIEASMNVNFTVDNSHNWVPTLVHEMKITVSNPHTHATLGHGSLGAIELAPRTVQNVPVTMNISYTTTSPDDATWQNLYNACGVQVKDPTPTAGMRQENLYLAFDVDIHIAGIAWTSTVHVEPPGGLECSTLL